MGRQAGDVNASNVFPVRALGGLSERWGRMVEDRVLAVEKAYSTVKNSIANANRTTAATLSNLAGQIDQLATAQAMIPLAEVSTVTATGWQATDGGIIASTTIVWPEGKTRGNFAAWMNGFYVADYSVPVSDRPAFSLGIGSAYSDPLPKIPDNMDTYWLVGSFALLTDQDPAPTSITFRVKTDTGASLSAAYAENTVSLQALAIFS